METCHFCISTGPAEEDDSNEGRRHRSILEIADIARATVQRSRLPSESTPASNVLTRPTFAGESPHIARCGRQSILALVDTVQRIVEAHQPHGMVHSP